MLALKTILFKTIAKKILDIFQFWYNYFYYLYFFSKIFKNILTLQSYSEFII